MREGEHSHTFSGFLGRFTASFASNISGVERSKPLLPNQCKKKMKKKPFSQIAQPFIPDFGPFVPSKAILRGMNQGGFLPNTIGPTQRLLYFSIQPLLIPAGRVRW